MIMNQLYGGVCYAGIDTDPELKYPKGAGRVAFSNQQSYIAAISARFVQLQHGDIDKRVCVLCMCDGLMHNSFTGFSLSHHRSKWSLTCWMTSCVTSAKVLAVGVNLRRSSAPMSLACSTTVNTAGRRSTPDQAGSSTNPWWKKGLTGLVQCPSVGAELAAADTELTDSKTKMPA